jgi:hypothetical protein
MKPVSLRESAQELRRKGESINDIARRLNASKSSVSYWCRDIRLSDRQAKRLAEKRRSAGALGRLRAAEKKRVERLRASLAEAKRGAKEVGALNKRDLFILGIGLYWGEGYKKANEECGFTNSDPGIILAYMAWLKRICRVPVRDLILRVSINSAHAHRVHAAEKFWSQQTKVPMSQFTKASVIQSIAKKRYADPTKHFGTLRVKVRRATALRRRILGSIAEVQRQLTQ